MKEDDNDEKKYFYIRGQHSYMNPDFAIGRKVCATREFPELNIRKHQIGKGITEDNQPGLRFERNWAIYEQGGRFGRYINTDDFLMVPDEVAEKKSI